MTDHGYPMPLAWIFSAAGASGAFPSTRAQSVLPSWAVPRRTGSGVLFGETEKRLARL